VRTAILLLGIAAACKGNDAPPKQAPASPPAVADASVPAQTEWTACDAVLGAAPKLPATRRVQAILDACKPCGDWAPLLTWNKLQEDGGPTRASIEATMLGCNAYCDPNAKMRFLGALDTARGQDSRAPWRMLGDFCKDKVSAAPDARYMSAPYFALDRIARAVAARPGGAKLLDAIDLPLPAVTVTGVGPLLAVAPVTAPFGGPAQINVTMTEIRVGTLPHARLGAGGVTVTGDYPGTLVTTKDLAATLDKVPGSIALFAPSGMHASRVLEVVAAAGTHPVRIAVAADGAPIGWTMYGTIPIDVTAGPDPKATKLAVSSSNDGVIKSIGTADLGSPPSLVVDAKATVADLAKVLGVLAYKDVHAASVTPSKHP
jgi:hypothetical protein